MKKSIHRMYFAKYLLSIEECDEALMQRAFSRVDETRREKAGRMRTAKSRAACLGAGLLLQLAVGEALQDSAKDCSVNGKTVSACDGSVLVSSSRGDAEDGDRTQNDMMNEIRRYSAYELLTVLDKMPYFSFEYRYGKNGKPYFLEYPFYFNLSHSGDYVLCGLAEAEIGADIQRHCACDRKKLAGRFFSEQERAALAASGEDEALFFRLWARKEAYGKLTGDGIASVMDVNVMTGNRLHLIDKEKGREVRFEESDELAGYSIAFCRYTENGKQEL